MAAAERFRTAVTVCLVAEARHGPFVFHAGDMPGGLEAACRAATDAGFEAIELFPAAGAAAFPAAELRRLLPAHGLAVAAVGTGAGWVKHGLHLCHPDPAERTRAREFIAGIIDSAGEFGAPAIIGSMQGRTSPAVPRAAALDLLADALDELGRRAARHAQPLLYEPLNRYETDLFNRQTAAAEWLAARGLEPVRLLGDLFHMNIEEADLAATLEALGDRLGHVHWADSNRRAVGFGHTPVQPVVAALGRIGYAGYLSAEVFPLPTAAAAARQTMASLIPASCPGVPIEE
jgi:sugar phosphate isomerase/epimerase